MIIWKYSHLEITGSWLIVIVWRRFKVRKIYVRSTVRSSVLENGLISRSWRPVMCTLWIRKMKCTAVSLWQEKDSKMQISRHRCICIRQMKCWRSLNTLVQQKQKKLSLTIPIWLRIWWKKYHQSARISVHRSFQIQIKRFVKYVITRHILCMEIRFRRLLQSVWNVSLIPLFPTDSPLCILSHRNWCGNLTRTDIL